jgi:hypothetical protein
VATLIKVYREGPESLLHVRVQYTEDLAGATPSFRNRTERILVATTGVRDDEEIAVQRLERIGNRATDVQT